MLESMIDWTAVLYHQPGVNLPMVCMTGGRGPPELDPEVNITTRPKVTPTEFMSEEEGLN